jgi:hypothetical protein
VPFLPTAIPLFASQNEIPKNVSNLPTTLLTQYPPLLVVLKITLPVSDAAFSLKL